MARVQSLVTDLMLASRVSEPLRAAGHEVVGGAEPNPGVDAIVELFGWPRETMEGEPVIYRGRRVGEQALVDGSATVVALALVHGDALVLGPVHSDGAAP